jgi:hypothetical protein
MIFEFEVNAQIELVKDINTTKEIVSSSPKGFFKAGSWLYFQAEYESFRIALENRWNGLLEHLW